MKKIITGLLLVMPMVASAQDYYGTNDFATGNSRIYVGTKDIKATVAGIINIVLGFLGILATLLILYGGFTWMMSQGNSEKIDKAKGIIGAGVVGLVIIFVAYAIARFVLTSLQKTA
jgi:phage shock protein PspC (stress-responsive transcriptional regulator)